MQCIFYLETHAVNTGNFVGVQNVIGIDYKELIHELRKQRS